MELAPAQPAQGPARMRVSIAGTRRTRA